MKKTGKHCAGNPDDPGPQYNDCANFFASVLINWGLKSPTPNDSTNTVWERDLTHTHTFIYKEKNRTFVGLAYAHNYIK